MKLNEDDIAVLVPHIPPRLRREKVKRKALNFHPDEFAPLAEIAEALDVSPAVAVVTLTNYFMAEAGQ